MTSVVSHSRQTSFVSHGRPSVVSHGGGRSSVVSQYGGQFKGQGARPTSSTFKDMSEKAPISEEEEYRPHEDTDELLDVSLEMFSNDGEGDKGKESGGEGPKD